MSGSLGEMNVRLGVDSSGLTSGFRSAASAMSGFAGNAPGLLGPLGTAAVVAGAAVVGIGVAAVKMAGDFQQGLTTLVTGAGESASNIKMVGDGILQLATQTGTSTKQLTDGMFMIESAGHHGADGLNVLKVAAEGAKVGNADLGVVANAMTTYMQDYHLSSDHAATAMNWLTAVVSNGKTHMQDLASSMAGILPIASAYGISAADVGGALATMTNAGMSAQNASHNLANALRSLEAPGNTAQKAMKSVGLSADEVHNAIVRKGLPGAFQLITDAVGKKFPEGSVAYNEAMKKIMGGATGLNVALMLGGKNADAFKTAIQNVGDAMKNGGDKVTGWDKVQGDFNFKMDQAKEALEVLGIKVGTALLPVLSSLLDKVVPLITNFTDWITNGKDAAGATQFLSDAGKDLKDIAKALSENFGPLIKQFMDWTEKNHVLEKALAAGSLVMKGFTEGIKFAAPVVADIIRTVGQFAVEIGERLWPLIQNFMNWWNSHWPQIRLSFKAVWDEICGIVKIAWSVASGIIKIGLDILNGDWGKAWQDCKDMLKGVWDGIQQYFKGAMEGLVANFKPLFETLSHVPGPVGDMAKSVLKSFDLMDTGTTNSVSNMKTNVLGRAQQMNVGMSAQTAAIQIQTAKHFDDMRMQLIDQMKNTSDPVQRHALAMRLGVLTHTEMMHLNAARAAQSMASKVTTHASNMKIETIGHAHDMATQLLVHTGTMHKGAVEHVAGMHHSIGSDLSQLALDAGGWASDMMSNFVGGILGGIGNVGNAVSQLAGTIAANLHFSKPDVGVLATSDTWMPDFTEMISGGIAAGVPKIEKSVKRVASSMAALNPQSPMNSYPIKPNASMIASSVSSSASAPDASSGQPIYITMLLDSQVLANAQGNTMQRQIYLATGLKTA